MILFPYPYYQLHCSSVVTKNGIKLNIFLERNNSKVKIIASQILLTLKITIAADIGNYNLYQMRHIMK